MLVFLLIGKSSESTNNWYYRRAQQGGQGDLRRGNLHREFGLPRENGVSDFLAGGGDVDLTDIVKPTLLEGLDLITCGKRPPDPGVLLKSKRLPVLIDSLANICDHVIVDAPPILSVSDAAILGNQVGTTLLIARAGRHSPPELEQTVKQLALAGIDTVGYVLNDYDTMRLRYRYGYGGYRYGYRYKYR